MKAVQPVITSNGVPYFQIMSVGSHGRSWRNKEERDGKGRGFHQIHFIMIKL